MKLVRKLLIFSPVLVCLSLVVVLGASEVAAQTFPCCENGQRPGKKCTPGKDSDCKGVCLSGGRAGKQCDSVTRPCPNGCQGGARPGRECEIDADCDNACVGGIFDGQKCDEDRDCQGECLTGPLAGSPCRDNGDCQNLEGSGICGPLGSCSNIGTCTDIGVCEDGTCTGICEEAPPKTPMDPKMASVQAGSTEQPKESVTRQPCP